MITEVPKLSKDYGMFSDEFCYGLVGTALPDIPYLDKAIHKEPTLFREYLNKKGEISKKFNILADSIEQHCHLDNIFDTYFLNPVMEKVDSSLDDCVLHSVIDVLLNDELLDKSRSITNIATIARKRTEDSKDKMINYLSECYGAKKWWVKQVFKFYMKVDINKLMYKKHREDLLLAFASSKKSDGKIYTQFIKEYEKYMKPFSYFIHKKRKKQLKEEFKMIKGEMRNNYHLLNEHEELKEIKRILEY